MKVSKLYISILVAYLFLCCSIINPAVENAYAAPYSTNYRITSSAILSGVKSASTNIKSPYVTIGDTAGTESQSVNYRLYAGFINTISDNPPVLIYPIPNANMRIEWNKGASNPNVFDLDNYFVSPDNLALSYICTGNSNISVTIDPVTHLVSFSQPSNYSGVEKVRFIATDENGNKAYSNTVALIVKAPANNPPVIFPIDDVAAYENDLIRVSPNAYDPDGDALSFSYSYPFNNNGTWQTTYDDAGSYTITVTVSDGTYTDSERFATVVRNVNRSPVLSSISDITANEGDLVIITPNATDPDGDYVTFIFEAPFDSEGRWQTGYNDHTTITTTVTATDGNLSVSQNLNVTIIDVNVPPRVELILSTYSTKANENFQIYVYASDEDRDALSLTIKQDTTIIQQVALTSNSYTMTHSIGTSATYTISAMVSDSVNSATDSRNIEIVPTHDIDRDKPIAGDFNGDGILDIGAYDEDRGEWFVALSNNGNFYNFTQWLTGFGGSNNWIPIGGDFNTDGKSDIAIYNKSSGEFKVAISNGSSFVPESANRCTQGGSSWSPLTGDFNGDGYIDFGVFNYSSGEFKIGLYDGTNVGTFTIWADIAAHDSWNWAPFTGDFNGDGLTDVGMFKGTEGRWRVVFSNGSSFVDSAGTDQLVNFGNNESLAIADFNNDSMTDAGYKDENGDWYVALCDGENFHIWPNNPWYANFGNDVGRTDADKIIGQLGDCNGDGINDFAIFDRTKTGVNKWAFRISSGTPGDLIKVINNGIGGEIEIWYKPSTEFDNTGDDDICDLPFVISAISKVEKRDGQGNSYVTRYFYKNGLFDFAEREFRGFGYVWIKDDEENVSESWFEQGGILKGKLKKQLIRDSYDNIWSKTETIWHLHDLYAGRVKLPYTYEVNNYTYSGETTTEDSYLKQVQAVTTYNIDTVNNLINVSTVEFNGDLNNPDDNKTQVTTFDNSLLATHIIMLPSIIELKDKNGSVKNKAWNFYNNKGQLIRTASYLTSATNPNDPGNPSIHYDYESSYGNLIRTTDPNGHYIETEYEQELYQYPRRITNQLLHTQEFEYNYLFGKIRISIDPNGKRTENIYDGFGRLISIYGPKDRDDNLPSVMYDYNLNQIPNVIIKRLKQKYYNPGIYLKTFTYTDGFGRVMETISLAQDPTKLVISGIVRYDYRGNVKEAYSPYFTNRTPEDVPPYRPPTFTQPHTSYFYDALNRVTKVVNPDNTYSETIYRGWTVTYIDENKNRKDSEYNAYNQLVKVTEYIDSQNYVTQYEYDVSGNLVRVIDSAGNVTNITYDSLGRKTSMSDPDMDAWSYVYDKVGNLRFQTDAKGQTIEFQYDELNRLTHKIFSGPDSWLLTVTYEYNDDLRGLSDSEIFMLKLRNKIGRLNKVDDPNCTTEFFYDELGREIKTTKTIKVGPGGGPQSYTVERTYDPMDRLETLKYPDGEILTYTYNNNTGQLVSIIGIKETVATTYASSVTYNQYGQIKDIYYGNSTETHYTYDELTLRLNNLYTADINKKTVQNLNYNFDNAGNITHIIDSVNTATQSFSYDTLSRLIYAGGAYGGRVYRYDSIGNILQKGNWQYIYPNPGEPKPHAVQEIQFNGNTIYSFTYDANGNMLSKVGATKSTSYIYDSQNRLIGASVNPPAAQLSITLQLERGWNFISLPFAPASPYISDILSSLAFGIDYDQVTRYNARSGKFESYCNNPSYNDFNTMEYLRGYQIHCLQPCTLTITGTPPQQTEPISLKAGWNLIGIDYASDSKLASKIFRKVDYSNVKTYNPTTGLLEDASFRTLKAGVGYAIYCNSDSLYTPDTLFGETTFTYDGDGGRVKRTTPNDETIFIGSLYEIRNSNIEIRNTKHIFLGDTRICSVNVGARFIEPEYAYYHGDHLGSTSDITNAAGAVIQHTEYFPYGETYIQEGEEKTEYLYTGKLLDSSTGLYYYGARYYDPEIARFTQPDSIIPDPGDPQAFNRYAYARNNPIRYTDPTGHSFWDKIKSWIGDIAGAVMGVITFAMTGNIALSMAAYSFVSGTINTYMAGYSVGESIGIGILAGSAGFLGGSIGGALGGGAGTFGGALLGGAMGGAAGGATYAALAGGDVGRAALAGAAGGAIAGVGGFMGGIFAPAGVLAGGGVAAEIAGGEFSQGAMRSIVAASMSGAFQTARDIAIKSNEGTSLTPKLSSSIEKQHKIDQMIAASAAKGSSVQLLAHAQEFANFLLDQKIGWQIRNACQKYYYSLPPGVKMDGILVIDFTAKEVVGMYRKDQFNGFIYDAKSNPLEVYDVPYEFLEKNF